MKNRITELKEQFNKDLKKALEDALIEAAKADKSYRILALDKTSLCLRVFKYKVDVESNKTCVPLQSWSFTKELIRSIDKNNSKLFSFLSKDEQKTFMSRQRYHLDRDDFVEFDIDERLFDYVRDMFKNSFDKYMKHLCERIYENDYLKSEHYQQIIKSFERELKLACSSDETLERVKQEKIELDERIEKLEKFIGSEKFNEINQFQRFYMPLQLEEMKRYSAILKMRINFWYEENTELCCSCGAVIPEGTQYCKNCMEASKNERN